MLVHGPFEYSTLKKKKRNRACPFMWYRKYEFCLTIPFQFVMRMFYVIMKALRFQAIYNYVEANEKNEPQHEFRE